MNKDADMDKKLNAQGNLGNNLERAWFYGYKAAQRGFLEESNPFHLHSENYSLWVEGWWVGFYE